MTTTSPTQLDSARLTRAQRATLPLSADVAQALAEQHGVCIRPLAMRRIDTTTGRSDIVPVACGSTREDQCPPCADKARRHGWPWRYRPGPSGRPASRRRCRQTRWFRAAVR